MPDADRDAFDEVDEALHLGRLLLAVLTAHGCGCVHCAKAWDALDEYPEFAGDASCRPIGFNPMRQIDGSPTTSRVASHGGDSPQRGIGEQGAGRDLPLQQFDGQAEAQ